MWRTSSAIASSTASWISSIVLGACSRTTISSEPAAKLSSVGESGIAIGVGLVERVQDVVRDAGTDHLQEDGRRHRQPETEYRFVGLVDGVPVLERVHQHGRRPAEDPVHDERRRIADEHAALAELPGHVPGGCESDVVGQRRAHELDEREHRDRVEEVHPHDALRVLEVGAHLRDRERRGVRREQALRRDDALELGEDLLLHRHLLEDRFEDEIRACEDLPARAAGDE